MKILLEHLDIEKLNRLHIEYLEYQAHSDGMHNRLNELRSTLTEEKRDLAMLKDKIGTNFENDPQYMALKNNVERAKNNFTAFTEKRNQHNAKINNAKWVLESIATALVKHNACPDFLTIREGSS